MSKAQHGILRFHKYKGPEIGQIEAHNERTKEKYASNPDIDPARKHLNYNLLTPPPKYRPEAERQIREAGCRTRKDSVRLVETMITASPEFFQNKNPQEDLLQKEIATQSSILAWKIPRTEEPGELQSVGLHTVRPNLASQPRQQHLLKSNITGHLNFCSLDAAKNLIAILIYQKKKETATHASILAWRITRTEEPGELQSMGSQRVR